MSPPADSLLPILLSSLSLPPLVHSPLPAPRIKLLVSDSTLADYWETAGFPGDSTNIETLSMRGGTIEQLTIAFEECFPRFFPAELDC